MSLAGILLVTLFAGLVVLDTLRPKTRFHRVPGQPPKRLPEPAKERDRSDLR